MSAQLGAAGACAAASGGVSLPGGDSESIGLSPQTAGHQFNTDGSGTSLGMSGNTPNWHFPVFSGVGSQYEIRAQLLSGDVPNGDALNTFLSLGTARSWSVTAGLVGTSEESTLLISIRRDGQVEILDSGTYSMYAERL